MSSVVTNSLIANTVTTNSLMTNSLSGNAIMVSGSVAGVSFVGNGAGLSYLNLANVTGTLAVGSGGTGVTTSTGAGSVVLSSAPVFNGTTTLQQMTEIMNSKTGATGVVTHDLSSGAVFYHSSIAANFTCNLTNVPTTDDRTLVVALVLNQGAVAYMCTALQIDGAAQTVKWQGGTVPSGTATKFDSVTFSMIRAGATWYVMGQNTNFG